MWVSKLQIKYHINLERNMVFLNLLKPTKKRKRNHKEMHESVNQRSPQISRSPVPPSHRRTHKLELEKHVGLFSPRSLQSFLSFTIEDLLILTSH